MRPVSPSFFSLHTLLVQHLVSEADDQSSVPLLLLDQRPTLYSAELILIAKVFQAGLDRHKHTFAVLQPSPPREQFTSFCGSHNLLIATGNTLQHPIRGRSAGRAARSFWNLVQPLLLDAVVPFPRMHPNLTPSSVDQCNDQILFNGGPIPHMRVCRRLQAV